MECYYFGTFNPVHLGHIKTAKEIVKNLGFEKVVFVPCYKPCHKSDCANPNDRFNMLKLIEDNEIEVSDIEYKLGGESFSYRTIEALLDKKEGRLNFVIGFDAFKNIKLWKNPEILRDRVHFIVLKRKDEKREDIEKLKNDGYDFEITDMIDMVDISSTQIRNYLQTGKSITGLVDEKVKRYINENGLYRRN